MFNHGSSFTDTFIFFQSFSHVWLFVIPWTIAHQALLPIDFSRQEYWSGLSFPSPEDFPYSRTEPESPALWADSLPSEPPVTCYVQSHICHIQLSNPMDYSPPDSSAHGILQAGMLEWVAISYSRGSSQSRDRTHISFVSCIGRQVLYY